MNEIKSIVDAYNEQANAYETKYKKLTEAKNRAEKRLEKHTRTYPTRSKAFIVPLAKYLMEKCGFKCYEIYGPFGITSETSLYLANEGKNGDVKICEVETWSLTFTRKFENDKCIPLVWTGKTTNEYAEGTVGYYNGLNNIYVPIPDDVDELIKMLRHSPAKEKGE